jgi:hypothetical protein
LSKNRFNEKFGDKAAHLASIRRQDIQRPYAFRVGGGGEAAQRTSSAVDGLCFPIQDPLTNDTSVS